MHEVNTFNGGHSSNILNRLSNIEAQLFLRVKTLCMTQDIPYHLAK